MNATDRIHLMPLMVAACYGSDWISTRIERWTGSLFAPRPLMVSPSHVAVICRRHDAYLWVESTTMCDHPCLIRGEHVAGCQAHWLDYRVADYVNAGGRVDLYQPVFANRLTAAESDELSHLLLQFVERQIGYDLGGAMISGTRIYKRTPLAPYADLHKVFCSELVAKAAMRFGMLPVDNPAFYPPGELIRSMLRMGTIELAKRDVQPTEVTQ